MIERSPIHTVPDQSKMMEYPGAPEDTFYNQVFPSATQVLEPHESDSGSVCDDGKVYTSLNTDQKPRLSSVCGDRILSTDRINVRSWRNRHPFYWESHDITNWIYYVCSEATHIDPYKIRAEAFNSLNGRDLCSLSVHNFLELEPNYGMELYECLQSQLTPTEYKPPVDSFEMMQMDEAFDSKCTGTEISAMWSSAAIVEEDRELDLQAVAQSLVNNGSTMDLEALIQGVAVIGDKQYDYISDDGFDDIPQMHNCESGYGSDDSGRGSPQGGAVPPPAHNNHPQYMQSHPASNSYVMHQMQAPTNHTPPPAHMNNPYDVITQAPTPSAPKPRGRPKREGYIPGQRGRKPGQSTKGNHLWKFIRDTINDSTYNPEVIRWEDKPAGIFRIVNSAEMARLWGAKKNNKTMTYEKFSRAMRYCRNQGDFGALPKDRNLPKKLCFRFGDKKSLE